MGSQFEQQKSNEIDFRQSYKELQVLTEVEAFPNITQRVLSQRVGIALGLTNVLIRRLASKGYIRSRQASWKRWVYALTPEGAAHKILLTISYIRRVMNHYQKVRITLRERLEPLSLNKDSKVAIIGTSEIAELVYLGLKELSIDQIEIFAVMPKQEDRFLGMPVRDIDAINPVDFERILVASLNESTINKLVGDFDEHASRLVVLFSEQLLRV